jgi:hypothetical protein
MLVIYLIVFILFVAGLISSIKYFKHTASWEKFPSSEEYWSCLAWGWCSLMLTIICGIGLIAGIFLGICYIIL